MARDIVSSDNVDLESSGRRDYWVALGHTSVWSSHLIPLTVIVGPQARTGQGLVAFGGNHGNEYEGPVALKHLLREIRTEDVLGRLVLVPVLNVAAFHVGQRDERVVELLDFPRLHPERGVRVLAHLSKRVGTARLLLGVERVGAAFVAQLLAGLVSLFVNGRLGHAA